MNMKRLVSLCLSTALLAGCSDRPGNIIPEDKMVEIMADLQIAEAYERHGNPGSGLQGENRELLGRGVLIEHGVTVAEMDSTLAWYGRNMDEYSKLYKKVDERLARMQQKYAKAAGESQTDGPSSDIWPYGRHFVIDGNQLSRGLVVNIPLPEIDPGDRITWKMRTLGASSRHVTLGVDYDNGRTEIVSNSNSGMDPWIETSLQTDTLCSVSGLFAILDVDRSGPRAFVDSVQLLHFPFSREEYHKIGYQRKIGAPARVVRESHSDTVATVAPDTLKKDNGAPETPDGMVRMQKRD